MTLKRIFRRFLLTMAIAALPMAACSGDDDDAPGSADGAGHVASTGGASGKSGHAGSVSNAGADASADQACPTEIPTIGQPCRTRASELCQWKRSGPCPPDPDQLRKCINGIWTALAPAIACRDLDAGNDAGGE